MLTLFVFLFLTSLFQSSPLAPGCRPFFSHPFLFLFPRCGKYVCTRWWKTLLSCCDTKRDPECLFLHTHDFIPFTPLFSSRLQHHLFLIRTYFCRPLLPTSSRYPTRFRCESKTALDIYSRAIVSFSLGYSMAYLGIHTKKLCV